MSLVKTYVMLLCHACGVPFTSLNPIQSMYTLNDGVRFFMKELSYIFIYTVYTDKNSLVTNTFPGFPALGEQN